jgi:hypothetical protein
MIVDSMKACKHAICEKPFAGYFGREDVQAPNRQARAAAFRLTVQPERTRNDRDKKFLTVAGRLIQPNRIGRIIAAINSEFDMPHELYLWRPVGDAITARFIVINTHRRGGADVLSSCSGDLGNVKADWMCDMPRQLPQQLHRPGRPIAAARGKHNSLCSFHSIRSRR